MPGPSNTKAAKKHKSRKSHTKSQTTHSLNPVNSIGSLSPDPAHILASSPRATAVNEIRIEEDPSDEKYESNEGDLAQQCLIPSREVEVGASPMPQLPLLHDPGNGPRVRNIRAFLSSKYFAQPPALDVPLCAEFAQEEVLEMLLTVLPEEMALILWYNKSRATSRICPACQRIYRLGDILPDHFPDEKPKPQTLIEGVTTQSPQLEQEQSLSGLCSPVCFILASFNYPEAIRSAWGRTEEEFDDHTWDLLNGPAKNNATGDIGKGLSMLMRMTRLHDLGLAQLCLGLDVEDLRDSEHFPQEVLAVS